MHKIGMNLPSKNRPSKSRPTSVTNQVDKLADSPSQTTSRTNDKGDEDSPASSILGASSQVRPAILLPLMYVCTRLNLHFCFHIQVPTAVCNTPPDDASAGKNHTNRSLPLISSTPVINPPSRSPSSSTCSGGSDREQAGGGGVTLFAPTTSPPRKKKRKQTDDNDVVNIPLIDDGEASSSKTVSEPQPPPPPLPLSAEQAASQMPRLPETACDIIHTSNGRT